MKFIIRLFNAFDIVICMTAIIFSLFFCYIKSAISYMSLVPHSSLYECLEREDYVIRNVSEEKDFIGDLTYFRKSINKNDYKSAMYILDDWIKRTKTKSAAFDDNTLFSSLLIEKYFLLILLNPNREDYIAELKKIGVIGGDMFEDLCNLHSVHYGKPIDPKYTSRSLIGDLMRSI